MAGEEAGVEEVTQEVAEVVVVEVVVEHEYDSQCGITRTESWRSDAQASKSPRMLVKRVDGCVTKCS